MGAPHSHRHCTLLVAGQLMLCARGRQGRTQTCSKLRRGPFACETDLPPVQYRALTVAVNLHGYGEEMNGYDLSGRKLQPFEFPFD